MRRRERAYALVLGTICALSLLGGAWPLPLLAYGLLELSYTARGARRRATRAARAAYADRSLGATGRTRLEVSSAVRHEHVPSG